MSSSHSEKLCTNSFPTITYFNNAKLPRLNELLHLSGKDKVASGLLLVLLIIQLCLPSARGSDWRLHRRWRRRGLSISSPAAIHHHDICKLVSKTCRQQGLRLWPAMSRSFVQDRASCPYLSLSGTSLFCQVCFFLCFLLLSFFFFFPNSWGELKIWPRASCVISAGLGFD